MNTATAGRLVTTPHPVTLDEQTNIPCELRPGESLGAFLRRHVDLSQQWEVTIGGVVVPVEHWERVKPKDGQMIEVRGAVNKQALYLVAMLALTYFTFGFGAAASGSLFIGSGAAIGGGVLAASATYVAGPALGGKVIK